ncbi:hypothetical protein VTO73DRAFT_13129 [Trametes versicolor]
MGTRPTIAFAVSTLAQFSHNPAWVHWEAVKRVFRYLLGTRTFSLAYGGDQRGFEEYVDADGASHVTGAQASILPTSWLTMCCQLARLLTCTPVYILHTSALACTLFPPTCTCASLALELCPRLLVPLCNLTTADPSIHPATPVPDVKQTAKTLLINYTVSKEDGNQAA